MLDVGSISINIPLYPVLQARFMPVGKERGDLRPNRQVADDFYGPSDESQKPDGPIHVINHALTLLSPYVQLNMVVI